MNTVLVRSQFESYGQGKMLSFLWIRKGAWFWLDGPELRGRVACSPAAPTNMMKRILSLLALFSVWLVSTQPCAAESDEEIISRKFDQMMIAMQGRSSIPWMT